MHFKTEAGAGNSDIVQVGRAFGTLLIRVTLQPKENYCCFQLDNVPPSFQQPHSKWPLNCVYRSNIASYDTPKCEYQRHG